MGSWAEMEHELERVDEIALDVSALWPVLLVLAIAGAGIAGLLFL